MSCPFLSGRSVGWLVGSSNCCFEVDSLNSLAERVLYNFSSLVPLPGVPEMVVAELLGPEASGPRNLLGPEAPQTKKKHKKQKETHMFKT